MMSRPPLIAFDTEDEVIARANDTLYGLAAYFYTRDVSRVIRVAERLEYGIIGANDGLPSTAQAPFGGVKHSGLGREGGSVGIEEYLEEVFPQAHIARMDIDSVRGKNAHDNLIQQFEQQRIDT